MATATTNAKWAAGYPARLDMPGHPQDGIELVPGETVVEDLPRGEVEGSVNWSPVKAQAKAADKPDEPVGA